MSEPIVQCRAVTKRFGARLAVDDLDLDIPAGICFGLLGPNGAGKTTSLRMIYGVTRPTSGSAKSGSAPMVFRGSQYRSFSRTPGSSVSNANKCWKLKGATLNGA